MNSFLLTENEIGRTHTFFVHAREPSTRKPGQLGSEGGRILVFFWLILMKVRLYQANVFIDIDIPEYRIPESSFDSD